MMQTLLMILACAMGAVQLTPETVDQIAQAAGGDEIILAPGTYIGPIRLANSQAGTAEKPTTLRAATPGTVRIVGAKPNGDGIIVGSECRFPDGCHWVIVDGLEVCWSKRDGIRVHGSHVTIRNCYLHHNGIRQASPGEAAIAYSTGQGVGSWFQQFVTVENCRIEYNGSSAYDHGIYMHGTGHTIRRCTLQRNAGSGIQLSNPSSEFTIEDCVIAGNGAYGIHAELPETAERFAIRRNVFLFNTRYPLALIGGGAAKRDVSDNWIYGNSEPVLATGGSMPRFPVETQPE